LLFYFFFFIFTISVKLDAAKKVSLSKKSSEPVVIELDKGKTLFRFYL